MLKSKATIAALLLFCMLVAISVPPLSLITTVKASTTNAEVIFGSPDDGLISSAESQATTSGCATIQSYFDSDENYQYEANLCGGFTSYSAVYGENSYFNSNFGFATAFYKGDSCYCLPGQSPNTYSHNIYWMYPDNNPPGTYPNSEIWDEMIGQNTGNGVNHFVFLWSCMLADQLGGISGTDIWGMAPAWLHTTNIQTVNAYNDPDSSGKCFIGFDGESMPWSAPTNYLSCTYQTFATDFYYFLVVDHYSIVGALNLASEDCIGVPFNTILDPLYNGYTIDGNFGQMCVWGDPAITIP